jgi:hypothetical protein
MKKNFTEIGETLVDNFVELNVIEKDLDEFLNYNCECSLVEKCYIGKKFAPSLDREKYIKEALGWVMKNLNILVLGYNRRANIVVFCYMKDYLMGRKR